MQMIFTVLLTGLLSACVVYGQAVDALISPNSTVILQQGRTELGRFNPGLFESGWQGAGLSGAGQSNVEGPRKGLIKTSGGKSVAVELDAEPGDASADLHYRLTLQDEMNLNSLYVSLDLPEAIIAGGSWKAGGQSGNFSRQRGAAHLFRGDVTELELTLASGLKLALSFETPTPILLQDNRQWGPSFCVRIGLENNDGTPWPAGSGYDFGFRLVSSEGVNMVIDKPVTIEAGEEWIPLNVELDIEPGSALDFSNFGQLDAPAGKHGWLQATKDGHFAFTDSLQTPRRFYGVNFCFSALYITHDQADIVVERLVRLGYNSVRVHHYEGELVDRSVGTSTVLNPQKLDQLDYLLAAFKKQGIYTTTDLYVSRPVFANEIWPGESGEVGMDEFKMLVPVNDNAMENFKQFASALLTHENPYTGMRYADDPALAWLSMINEGNYGNFLGSLSDRGKRDWQAAWNRWLKEKYGLTDAIETAWGDEIEGDLDAGTVSLGNLWSGPSAQDMALFLADTEKKFLAEMRRWLRDEIGTKALLTNQNGWTNMAQNQLARQDYDYVDDHFYVDHPEFIERSWSLPSRCGNRSPVADGAPGGRNCGFFRLWDKPFTISEFNYSAPGRFRGVGGIITGCMAALQDWSVVWRFAYSHGRENLIEPKQMDYFNVASDPLNLAAERATMCLFLRGDMQPAPHKLAIAFSEDGLREPGAYHNAVPPEWNALALVTGIGTVVRPGVAVPTVLEGNLKTAPDAMSDSGIAPYESGSGDELLSRMREQGWLAADNQTDLSLRRSESETGELIVDAPRDILTLNTPLTAGGYAPTGESIKTDAVTVNIKQTDATVWVSSLDGKPIGQSKHLLITHLTDLQNSGTRFAENARQTLLDWGRMPHLMRAGEAEVVLQTGASLPVKVYELATSGKRLGEVTVQVEGNTLTIPLSIAGPNGARMLYEVVVGGSL